MDENEKSKKKFKLSSLFFEEDEIEKKEENTEQVKSAQADVPADKIVATRTSEFDKRVYDSLIKALEQNNMEGFDYFEFKNSLEALKNVIMDEATRFKSAYATATTLGVDVKKIVDSANFYLKILKDEDTKFKNTLDKTAKEKVASKEAQINDIENLIKKKSDEIKKLTEEINNLQADKVKMTNGIAENKVKIEVTKNNFYATYNELTKKIKDDINKINTYLK